MATRAAPVRRMAGEHIFYSGMAIAMVLVLIAGFLPSYYARGIVDAGHPLLPLSWLAHVHGLLFTVWMLLYLVQTLLAGSGRRDLHMKLGILGFVMLPPMIVVALGVSIYGIARKSGPPIVPPESWYAIPIFAMLTFAVLIGWALAKRRDVQSHKRLMLMAMICMTGPGFGRMPWPAWVPGPVIIFGFSDLFLLALVSFDLARQGQLHKATIRGGAFLIALQIAPIAVWQMEWWIGFARWSDGLVA